MDINELYKIICSDKPSKLIKEKEELIFNMIPELKVCKGFEQNNIWHIYDVYEHILHVLDNVSPNVVMRLSALFHDIGKPVAYTVDENNVGHFYKHWEYSKEIFNSFAIKYNIDGEIIDKVSNLVYYHDKNIDKLSDSEIDEMVSIFGYEGIKNLYELKKADLLAQNSKFHYVLDKYKIQEEKLLNKAKK